MRGRRLLPGSRFLRAREAVSAIEFALIAPFVSLLLLGSFSLFFLYQDSYRVETATFTVADIVSRQSTVDKAFLDTTYAMFVKMLPDRRSDVRFRISSLKKTAKAFEVDWSYPVAPMAPLTMGAIPTASLPLVSENDSIVLLETSVGTVPITTLLGLPSVTFDHKAANRPRFTSAIAKVD